MATIHKVPRKNGHAWLAVVNLRGIKPFAKTFRLKANASTRGSVDSQTNITGKALRISHLNHGRCDIARLLDKC